MKFHFVLLKSRLDDKATIVSGLLNHTKTSFERHNGDDLVEFLISRYQKLGMTKHQEPFAIASIIISLLTTSKKQTFWRQYKIIKNEFKFHVGLNLFVVVHDNRLFFLEIMVIWTIYSSIALSGLFLFDYRKIDHFHYKVSL